LSPNPIQIVFHQNRHKSRGNNRLQTPLDFSPDSSEAIAIAVMNGDGKVVMESIIETKASTIVQFLLGLRGELHVTFEEGTWAAWLYDLLKPQITELIVRDPRRNALMKEGNKSDKIDARKLADLLRGGYLSSVYHGENGLRTLEGTGPQLSDDQQRSQAGDESGQGQGAVSKLGDSVWRTTSLRSPSSCGVVAKDRGSGRRSTS
jgi:hypothetical protein